LDQKLEELGVQIREKHGALQLSLKRTVHQAIELGELVAEAKPLLPHGSFTPWIEKQGLEARTAQRYMELFEYKAKTVRVSDLTTAYALIEEIKSQTKEIKKAVEEKIITPEQAQALEPDQEFADQFDRARQAKKTEQKQARRNEPAPQERVATTGPRYDNYDVVARMVKLLSAYLDELPDNTRRIELCHDLIKYLKAQTNEYQRASTR
jgi:hypothetical protein